MESKLRKCGLLSEAGSQGRWGPRRGHLHLENAMRKTQQNLMCSLRKMHNMNIFMRKHKKAQIERGSTIKLA
jgi:hypothetical protein